MSELPKAGEVYRRPGVTGKSDQVKERVSEVYSSLAAHLLVEEVVPGDELGREVRGSISVLRGPERPYACELRVFHALWPEGPS